MTITDQEIDALRERNAARAADAIAALGSRYLCHPSNRVTRKCATSVLSSSRAPLLQLRREVKA